MKELQHLHQLNDQLVQDNRALIDDMQHVALEADTSASQLEDARADVSSLAEHVAVISRELRALAHSQQQESRRSRDLLAGVFVTTRQCVFVRKSGRS